MARLWFSSPLPVRLSGRIWVVLRFRGSGTEYPISAPNAIPRVQYRTGPNTGPYRSVPAVSVNTGNSGHFFAMLGHFVITSKLSPKTVFFLQFGVSTVSNKP
ncbi:hypothetical protein RHMOL_Rhmol08G0075300 [Rhododendron molle]|uniref:Uncharacterized protein n=1 Tax=Rhododendron molle TaxID=49168 RepID=A0ACC0MLV6_RHOML|nr:hypothetical protein RHMOL_Rhmol08G0075300 [Rhododendron molle]